MMVTITVMTMLYLEIIQHDIAQSKLIDIVMSHDNHIKNGRANAG